ncbi:MAG: molybdopterin-dependent oxidoreductase [Coriobacteriales bacterium]|nr:molybdopterin-dependent oxidoreductase [Coriobacteriales bacterium]
MKDSTLSRRTFVKGAALAGLCAAVSGNTLFSAASAEEAAGLPAPEPLPEDQITWGHCAINCPGRCALKIHTRDGELVQVETYSIGEDDENLVQPRCCLRGRAYRAWANDPDRLSYPMKRVGPRGTTQFERCSWDEAIDLIASNYARILQEYGPEAVYVNYASGSSSATSRPFNRLANLFGGYIGYYGSYSTAQISWITPYVWGGAGASTIQAAADSDLILMFGTSPVETRQGGAVSHGDYVRMRNQTMGKIYVIDPRQNDSVAGHSDEWLPINPGTDAAFVSAIIHEFIVNGWQNQEFLDKYTVGFDEEHMPESAQGQNKSYTAYIMGLGYDMVEKTPEWAQPICGIAADKIRSIAEEIHNAKALFVDQGWGPQRRSNGEMTAMAITMLPVVTGMLGKPGTSNGTREGSYSIGHQSIAAGSNPIGTKISCFNMVHAIDHGTEMTEYHDGVTGAEKLNQNLKFVFNYGGNCITNQNGDINWIHDVMSDETKCEFVAGVDVSMCDSAKYFDVLLPDTFRFEQMSMIGTGGSNAYFFLTKRPYENKFERSTSFDMAEAIARKTGEYLGMEEDMGLKFTEGKTQEEMIHALFDKTRERYPQLPEWDEMLEMGVFTEANPKGANISCQAFVEDPEAHPLNTPSGKIEIYSEKLDTWIQNHYVAEDDFCAPVPVYAKEWYGIETTTEEYPLVLSDFHYRARIHSSWGKVDILRELNPQELWINPIDAEARGIMTGEQVRVTNQFGTMQLVAKVTPRIIPGVVGCGQGAWHNADMYNDPERIDYGGCSNTLATHRGSPFAQGNPQHTNICQVYKA